MLLEMFLFLSSETQDGCYSTKIIKILEIDWIKTLHTESSDYHLRHLCGSDIYVCWLHYILINYWIWIKSGGRRSWSHGSWIYNYLCNQCLRVRTPFMGRRIRYNIMW
jgi:hypothetical protein